MLVKPQVSYPGVYIQEVPVPPTGIAPIPTALTAFVGRTLYGTVNEPTLISSAGDFQTLFGGPWEPSPLTYAVQDYFTTGGPRAQALIVRVHQLPVPNNKELPPAVWVQADASDAADPKKIAAGGIATLAVSAAPTEINPVDPPQAPVGPPSEATPAAPNTGKVLTLYAASPGAWGNYLSVRFDLNGITDASAKALGFTKQGDLFNMTVTYAPPWGPSRSERYTNVSVQPTAGARRLDRVLQNQSTLVSFPWPPPPQKGPDPTAVATMVASFNKTSTDPDYWLKNLPKSSGGSDGIFLNANAYFAGSANQAAQTGIYSLEKADIFNLLCIPRDQWATDNSVEYAEIVNYCVTKRALWIMDGPAWQPPAGGTWDTAIVQGKPVDSLVTDFIEGALSTDYRNAAVYFPDVFATDPLTGQQMVNPITGGQLGVGPCGAVAGVYSNTDTTRGVWKAPAGRTDGALPTVQNPATKLNNNQNGTANLAGINCLRTFAQVGTVVWGARTLYGAEALEDAYKYVPVRRLTMYIEESLYRGLQWAVFEPNDETLWSAIRLMVTSFLNGLMQQGAFQGTTQKEAFFVNCDATTTSQDDIDNGICNVIVGIAPVKPAEFIVIYIQQMTAGSAGS